jgi:putative MFS transporter
MLAGELRNAAAPWRPEHRRQALFVTLLWNCVQLLAAPAAAFWMIHVREELGFTAAVAGDILFWGFAAGVAGSFAGGALADRLGRRVTCVFFFTLTAAAMASLFQARGVPAQTVAMVVAVFGSGAAGTAASLYSAELFPTAIRATAFGWTTHLFGRVSELAAPVFVSATLGSLGLGGAIAVTALGPVLGSILVWRHGPETRALTLEEVEQRLTRAPSPR